VDAIVLEDGVFRIREEDCIACHDCVKACPRNVMIIQPETGIPAKCILCGECALACPREAIAFSCENIAKECP
jgi:polysulfide reductase chain B